MACSHIFRLVGLWMILGFSSGIFAQNQEDMMWLYTGSSDSIYRVNLKTFTMDSFALGEQADGQNVLGLNLNNDIPQTLTASSQVLQLTHYFPRQKTQKDTVFWLSTDMSPVAANRSSNRDHLLLFNHSIQQQYRLFALKSDSLSYSEVTAAHTPSTGLDITTSASGHWVLWKNEKNDSQYITPYGQDLIEKSNLLAIPGKSRILKKIASKPNTDTLFSFDERSRHFIQITPSGVMTELNQITNFVIDLTIDADGNIWWIDSLGLWKGSQDGLLSSRVLKGTFSALQLDFENERPTFIKDSLGIPYELPLTGNLLVDLNQFINTKDSDYVECSALSTQNSVWTNVDGCLFIEKSLGTALNDQLDSVKVIAADGRGSYDTAYAYFVFSQEAPFSVQAPNSVLIQSYTDSIISLNIKSGDGYNPYLNILVRTGEQNFHETSDSICPLIKEEWIAQSFSVSETKAITKIKMSWDINQVAQVYLIEGDVWYDGANVIWKDYLYPGKQEILITSMTFLIKDSTYSVVVLPKDSAQGIRVCLDKTGSYNEGQFSDAMYQYYGMDIAEMQLIFSDYTSGHLISELGRSPAQDSIFVGILGGKASEGDTTVFDLLLASPNYSLSHEFTLIFDDKPGDPASHFEAGDDMIQSYAAGTYIYQGWLPELAVYPRSYEIKPLTKLDSSLVSGKPTIDLQGNLSLTLNGTRADSLRLQVRRCHQDTSLCSNWDTVTIMLNQAPQFTAPTQTEYTMQTGDLFSIVISISDEDPGDLEATTMNVVAEKQIFQNEPSIRYVKSHGIIQTFTCSATGQYDNPSIYALFKSDKIAVRIMEVDQAAEFSIFSSPRLIAEQWFDVETDVAMWHDFRFDNKFQLDSGHFYALFVGDLATTSYTQDSSHFYMATYAELDEAFITFNGTESYPKPIEYNLAVGLKQHLDSGWWTLDSLEVGKWRLNLSPAYKDTGLFDLKLYAESNTLMTPYTLSVEVQKQLSSKVWNLTAGSDLLLPVTPEPYRYYYQYPWIPMSDFPSDVYFESQKISPDTNWAMLLDVYTDGGLEIKYAGNIFGDHSFLVKACSQTIGLCSQWDTIHVEMNQSPDVMIQDWPDTVEALTQATVSISVSDPESDNTYGQIGQLQQILKQPEHSITKTGGPFGQIFTWNSSNDLGLIKVYAKFPRPYIRFIVGDADPNPTEPEESLVDQYAQVKANVWQWHTLAIGKALNLKQGQKYHFSFGYDEEDLSVSVAIDTMNHYDAGDMIVWPADHSGDETAIINTNRDLAFELYERKTAPTWVSVYQSFDDLMISLKPQEKDTGSYLFGLMLQDTIHHLGAWKSLQVVPPSSTVNPIKNPWDSLQIVTDVIGQALRYEINYFDLNDLPDSLQVILEIKNKKSGLDSSWIMKEPSAVLVPLAEGRYQWQWLLKNLKTHEILKQHMDSFSIALDVHTPPKIDTWYMVGFGKDTIDFDSLNVTSQIYQWNDSLSGTGDYQNRSDLGQSRPAEGYWYFAEKADSIYLNSITTLDSLLQWKVINIYSGWNMIANPYNWPISLEKATMDDDAQLNFWEWMPEQGDYQPVTILGPNSACWVNVPKTGVVQVSPHPVFDSKKALNKKALPRYISTEEWSLQLTLRAGGQKDEWNFVGIGQEKAKVLEPPTAMDQKAYLALRRSGPLLSSDITDVIPEQGWNIQMKSDAVRQGSLTITGTKALEKQGLQAVLVVDHTAKSIQDGESIEVQLTPKVQNASLYILDHDDPMALEQNMTNIQTTLIGHQLHVQYLVPIALTGCTGILEWYDINGKMLRHKNIPVLQAGTQQVTMDVGDLPQGIGLIRIKVEGLRSSQAASVVELF